MGLVMDVHTKTLSVLEFDKVRRRLADHASFSAGRELALHLEPSADADAVRLRLLRTSQARDYLDRHGSPPLAGAHDVRAEIEAAARGRCLLASELVDIRDCLEAAERARRALIRDRGGWPALAAIAERLAVVPGLVGAIRKSIDDEGRLFDDASPMLRHLRAELRAVHDRLLKRLEAMIARPAVRDCLQEPLITQREGRYVIPVRSELRTKIPGIVHDTSDSGATVFVEPLSLVELGNELRQLELEEEREAVRILRELSAQVGAEAEQLCSTVEALAELDLAFAAAQYGSTLRAVTPLVLESGESRANLPQARHPLIDPQVVVPVDVRIGDEFRQLVITGPNTGGKTVVLKTLGLCVLMAQSGLQVPAAEGAELSVFDAVYADIGDEQSIEQSLSTFSGHMTTIMSVLKEATDQSLVLLDELGAGTDPVEGEALAEAILEYLASRRIATVATSHYSRLKAYAHATPGVANASVEFDPVSLRPTYELTIGLPGRSNAIAIASRLGMPTAVVAAARRRLSADEVAVDELLAEIREARLAAVADREAAAAARRQAEEWAARLEAALTSLQAESAAILKEARQEAAAELFEARQAVARLKRRAEKAWPLPAAGQIEAARAELAEVATELDEAARRLASPESERLPAGVDPSTLQPGQLVRLASFAQPGEVIRVGESDVEVRIGRLRLRVPLSDVIGLAPAELPGRDVKLHRAARAPSVVPSEVHLRGLRVEEGLARLEAHLDEAVLQGLPWVRIVHGHGTGAMKAAVRELVRHHPHVTRSRSGEPGEGGDGVTIAYLE